jgi:hypothetical protein
MRRLVGAVVLAAALSGCATDPCMQAARSAWTAVTPVPVIQASQAAQAEQRAHQRYGECRMATEGR